MSVEDYDEMFVNLKKKKASAPNRRLFEISDSDFMALDISESQDRYLARIHADSIYKKKKRSNRRLVEILNLILEDDNYGKSETSF
jgi:hypothetical protein